MTMIPVNEADFLKYLAAEKQASPHTVDNYARFLRLYREWKGEVFDSWEKCTASDFREWLYECLKQDLSPASVRLRFAALRSFYKYLTRSNPALPNPV